MKRMEGWCPSYLVAVVETNYTAVRENKKRVMAETKRMGISRGQLSAGLGVIRACNTDPGQVGLGGTVRTADSNASINLVDHTAWRQIPDIGLSKNNLFID